MDLKQTVSISTKALIKNKMRSALTVLGVIIGISSVIVMMGLGNSVRIIINKKVYTIGNNAISIVLKKISTNESDISQITKMFPYIKYITPLSYISKSYVEYNNNKTTSCIFGTNNDFIKIRNLKLYKGRYFKEREILTSKKVTIIGSEIKKRLFPTMSALGENILVNKIPFKIIGILTEKGAGLTNRNLDELLIIPYRTVMYKIKGVTTFNELLLSIKSKNLLEKAKLDLSNYYKWKYNTSDFNIHSTEDQLELANSITNILNYLLIGVASIALFVGGIGIMNIMLVSVRERTREIGIRMAIGAKEKDILNQFLIEAVILSFLGGIVGITLGLSIYLTVIYITNWPFIFSYISVLLSLTIASSVGIIFGYMPAKKAASLKPIDALKFE